MLLQPQLSSLGASLYPSAAIIDVCATQRRTPLALAQYVIRKLRGPRSTQKSTLHTINFLNLSHFARMFLGLVCLVQYVYQHEP